MASWDSLITSTLSGLTGVVKAAIIFFIFANILYATNFNPLDGLMTFVNTFLDGGVTGLLVLVVFLSWL